MTFIARWMTFIARWDTFDARRTPGCHLQHLGSWQECLTRTYPKALILPIPTENDPDDFYCEVDDFYCMVEHFWRQMDARVPPPAPG